ELDRIQNRRQILRTEFGGFLIPQPTAGLNRAAYELHRVREVRDCRAADDGAVRRIVNLGKVSPQVRQNVQHALQAVQRIRLKQRTGDVGHVVDVVGENFAVLVQEWAKCGEQAVELLYRTSEVGVRVG